MGSVCCVPARDATLSNRRRIGESHRPARYSPSWSFRWDNYRRVAGEIGNPSCQSGERTSIDVSMALKDGTGSDREIVSDAGSPLNNLGTPISLKSPSYEGVSTNYMPPSETFTTSNHFSKVKNNTEVPEIGAVPVTLQYSMPSGSSFSTPGEPMCSQRQLLPASSTPSRRARRSPGHQLFRQISDSRILGLKSPNSNSVSEGRQSFVLSTFSNDLVGGSSDGWSLRTFSELVASSQRERWSFDSERFGSGRHKISESSSRFSYSPSLDLQTCGACLKVMAELSVIAVLACGHVYHAECLETMTTEGEKYDPVCPICTVGQKQASKMSRKASKAEADLRMKFQKISRNRVIDSYLDGEVDNTGRQKITGKGKFPKIELSSSSRISFAKPFLKRHFSLGSKLGKSNSEHQSSKKKGFWARYRRE
ncbi:BRCA1-associated protein-like protein 2 [Bienertia sinuspersici]